MYINLVFSLDPPLLAIVKKFSVDFDHRLTALEKSMGEFTSALTELKMSDDAENASLDQALARVQKEVESFTQQGKEMQDRIDALQAQVDSGSASPEDVQMLKDLKASSDARKEKLDALNPTNSAVLPPREQGSGVGPPPVAPTATQRRG